MVSTIGVRRNGQNGIHVNIDNTVRTICIIYDVKLCRLASEKHCIGPKLVSEAIS